MNEKEYGLLRLIAGTARGLLARYPFDSEEEMSHRWRLLGLYLADLQNLDDRKQLVLEERRRED